VCVCVDEGREVIWLTHFQGDLPQGQGPYLHLAHMGCLTWTVWAHGADNTADYNGDCGSIVK